MVDDANAYALFGDSLYAAPQEDILEMQVAPSIAPWFSYLAITGSMPLWDLPVSVPLSKRNIAPLAK